MLTSGNALYLDLIYQHAQMWKDVLYNSNSYCRGERTQALKTFVCPVLAAEFRIKKTHHGAVKFGFISGKPIGEINF